MSELFICDQGLSNTKKKKKKPNELNHSKDMYMGHMKPNESV